MSELAFVWLENVMFFSLSSLLRELQVLLDLGIRNSYYFQSTYSQVLFYIVLIALYPLLGEEL